MVPAVLFLILYTSAFWLSAAVSVVTLLALLEYTNLSVTGDRDRLTDLFGVLSGVLMPPLCYLYGKEVFLPLIIGSLFVFFLAGILRNGDFKASALDTALKTLGIVYIALPLSHVILLGNIGSGRLWMIFMLFIIWANDTFAYFTGKTIGRHKLSPFISPNKTVEGAVGGLAGGILAGYILGRYLAIGMGTLEILLFSLLLGLIGIIGDLSESLLKRSAGVKDSGHIIPGHGGVLDRIDSLLFPIPFIYYFLIFLFQA